MSQWGTAQRVNGARFIPHVHGRAFAPIASGDTVDTVIMLDDGGDAELAERTYAKISQRFCGKPYSEWLAMRQQPNAELTGRGPES